MTKAKVKTEVIEAEVVKNEMVAQAHTTTPMSLIEKAMAVGSDIDIDKMTKLFELNLKYEENEAKKAFNDAFTRFKSEAIEIIKTKNVDYTGKTGIRTNYNHAELGKVVELVAPKLAQHGLSHHWEYGATEQGLIEVTCVLTHEMGHSRSTKLSAARDDSGGKNSIQAVASTTSYLERYTFFAITGLASKEKPDDDGIGSEVTEDIEYINDEQVMNIDSLIAEVKADEAKFMEYLSITLRRPITTAGEIPAENYNFAVKALEAKRSK